MYTSTLITAPQTILETPLVENLRNAWGGGDSTLVVREHGRIRYAAHPDTRWSVWQDLQNLRVDMVVQPTLGRRKKMLLADMDSTMIEQECIDELADMAGVGDRVKVITARAMNGELDFESA